nr:GLUG motif-containing protein [uncultured Allomuricauda sp.]
MKSNPIKLYQKGIVLFLFVLPVLTTAQTNVSQPSGSGTSGDPYQISSLAHLSWLTQTSAAWSSYFEQTANIDASEAQYWDDADDNNDGDLYNDPNDLTSDGNNEGFSPIGNSSTYFEGIYNGQGHVIDGLFIDRPVTDYVGFIGRSNYITIGLDSSSILELGITNCNITGEDQVGALVGLSKHNIIGCYATGMVFGDQIVGGLLGESNQNIEKSYTMVAVSGSFMVGGLVGFSNESIENSYATGAVSGPFYVGGLIGNSFFGENDIFWDTDTSGQSTSGGDAVGKTTAEMQLEETFTNWDFSTIWKIDGLNNGGYPYLQWQQFDPEVTTAPVSDISQTTVTANGSLDNLGNPGATDHGFELSTTSDFSSGTTIFGPGAPSATGNYTQAFSGLSAGTTYYVRAYATNSAGTVYGTVESFTTHIVPTSYTAPSGSGTEADPYQISNLQELLWISQTPDSWDTYYEQTADIDATATQFLDDSDDNNDGDPYNDPNDLTSNGNNEGFSPIGNSSTHFEGDYNGQGHIVDGLFIDRPTIDNVGFIGKSNGSDSSILDLGITNCNVIGKEEVGTLVGSSSHNIIRCYATGTVEGDRYVGGLIGQSHRSIENSFSRASVSCPDEVGGLVGQSTRDIENSFSTGVVSGSSFVGGLVGLQTNVSTDCFWDTQTSGQSSSHGSEVGKTTSEMQQQTTFTNWDFSTVWKIDGINNDGYPYLQWQQFDPGVTTAAVSDISQTTVTANGSLDNLGNPSATDHGFDIGLDANFDFKATYSLGAPSSTGNFSLAITNLQPNTENFIRSWVSSDSGTIYGETVSFTTHIVPTSYTTPSGTGTQSDPYQISNLQELLWISQTADSWDMYFAQTADIDATATQFLDDNDDNNDGDPYNDPNDLTSDGNNEGFSPIGNNTIPFAGHYDGFGYALNNFHINRTTQDIVGLFGQIISFESTLANIQMLNVAITGADIVGGLVGFNAAQITNAHVSGHVSGGMNVGGVVGYSAYEVEINGGDVTHTKSSISTSYSSADVSGTSQTGGLIGYNTGNITNSYSIGNVDGDTTVGGLIGTNELGDIENTFSVGTVDGTTDVGGLIGKELTSIDLGGFTFLTGGTTDSFWNTESSMQGTSAAGNGKTTAEMQQQATFTNWDFGTIWKIDGINNNGYPYLQWQQFDPEVTTLAVSDLTATSVTVNGAMENLGNPQVPEHGLQLGEDVDFITKGTIVLGAPLDTGNFTAGFTELDQNTTYYVRAFVKDAFDVIHYGDTVEFTTLTDITAPTPSLQNVPAVVDGPFTLELVFDEEVRDLSPNPITVAPDANGLSMATLGDLVTVIEGFSYTIEVTPTIEGELRFFNENVGMARDLAGNNSNPLEEVTVIYDISAPELQSITLSSNNAGSASFARAGDEVYLDFESNEPLLNAIGNIHSTVVTFFNVEDNLWRGILPITESALEGNVTFELFVTDLYDNGLFVENTLDGSAVTVDVTAPTTVCQPMIITLDDSGNATISAEAIDNDSFDANVIVSRSIDVTAFTCEDLGEDVVNLTVTDVAGNSSSCSSVVTVVDNVLPVVLTTDMAIVLDAIATAQITAEDIDNGSSDNCGISTLQLDIDSFTADDFGENIVTLTAIDSSGNSTSGTATVTVSVLDDDGDGVPNFEDDCPDTPNGTAVDGTGCTIPELEINDFVVEMLIASCTERTDGALTVSATNTDFGYEVSFEGLDTFGLNVTEGFSTIIENLSAGSYNICFAIVGFPQTEVCTTAVIMEPEPLLVTNTFNTESGALELSLSGSNAYTITLNDEDFDVTGNSFSTVLSDTLTNLRVSTGFDCQGIYEEELIVSEEMLYGPNPTDGILNIYIPGTDIEVKIAVHNFSGNMVLLSDYEVTANRMLELDLGLLSAGTYMISIEGETVQEAFKIVRL